MARSRQIINSWLPKATMILKKRKTLTTTAISQQQAMIWTSVKPITHQVNTRQEGHMLISVSNQYCLQLSMKNQMTIRWIGSAKRLSKKFKKWFLLLYPKNLRIILLVKVKNLVLHAKLNKSQPRMSSKSLRPSNLRSPLLSQPWLPAKQMVITQM